MVAQMDDKNRALCFLYRNPPKGQKKLPYSKIADKVRNKDGGNPTPAAVRDCVTNFHKPKATPGRKKGWRKTTKAEDKTILKKFHKVRPPGHGVDSRKIHAALPAKLSMKIGRKTVTRRLAAKGYTPSKKVQKSDPGRALRLRRVDFAETHVAKSASQWKAYLQAVGDIKEFTYYPQELRARFKQLRAPWTYMTPKEKYKPAFVRPKRWFKKKDYKKVMKQKVFGLTTSTGKCLSFLVPKPFTSTKWAQLLKSHVLPFLKKTFPAKREYRILLDGEGVLRGEPAKEVMKDKGIKLLENWPKYSPDLNPQEHVWAGAEISLRAAEKRKDTFETFQKRCLQAVKEYKGAGKLVGSMAKRMKMVIEQTGAMIKK